MTCFNKAGEMCDKGSFGGPLTIGDYCTMLDANLDWSLCLYRYADNVALYACSPLLNSSMADSSVCTLSESDLAEHF